MEHTSLNPFIPSASLLRYPNGIYEVRLHLPGVGSNVDIVPHGNYALVTGTFVPRARRDLDGRHISTLVWTDQPCGHFGRDIPVTLAPGTELVVLERRQDCDDFVVRYTIRNSFIPRGGCTDGINSNNVNIQGGIGNLSGGTSNLQGNQGHHMHGLGHGFGHGFGHGYGHGHGNGQQAQCTCVQCTTYTSNTYGNGNRAQCTCRH